jgi:hypothetical protein
METKVILPPQEQQDHTLDMFLGAVERDPHTHLWRLATTLQLNKFDAEHQSIDDPIIVPRVYDDYGLVKTFFLLRHYDHFRSKISTFMEPIARKDYGEVSRIVSDVRRGDKEMSLRLAVMLALGGIEKLLAEMLTKDEFGVAPPLTKKEYSPNGVPSTFDINERAVHFERGSHEGYAGWRLSIIRPLYTERSPILRGR